MKQARTLPASAMKPMPQYTMTLSAGRSGWEGVGQQQGTRAEAVAAPALAWRLASPALPQAPASPTRTRAGAALTDGCQHDDPGHLGHHFGSPVGAHGVDAGAALPAGRCRGRGRVGAHAGVPRKGQRVGSTGVAPHPPTLHPAQQKTAGGAACVAIIPPGSHLYRTVRLALITSCRQGRREEGESFSFKIIFSFPP